MKKYSSETTTILFDHKNLKVFLLNLLVSNPANLKNAFWQDYILGWWLSVELGTQRVGGWGGSRVVVAWLGDLLVTAGKVRGVGGFKG